MNFSHSRHFVSRKVHLPVTKICTYLGRKQSSESHEPFLHAEAEVNVNRHPAFKLEHGSPASFLLLCLPRYVQNGVSHGHPWLDFPSLPPDWLVLVMSPSGKTSWVSVSLDTCITLQTARQEEFHLEATKTALPQAFKIFFSWLATMVLPLLLISSCTEPQLLVPF